MCLLARLLKYACMYLDEMLLWVQKLYYTIQHEGGRYIDLQQMSVSPGQTTANNCKTAFSLYVVDSASDDYSF